jgi:transcriptional regulator with XRE-family HTH domain
VGLLNIGKAIAYFIDYKKTTAGQLAEVIGLSPSALSQWINGKRNPNEDNLMKIARALDIPLKAIIERAEIEELEEKRQQGLPRDRNHDRLYAQQMRRRDFAYRNNDIVIEFTPELLLGIRARFYDINHEYTKNRDRLPSSVEVIFENVMRDFLRYHTDEIRDRLYHELQYAQKGIDDIISELDNPDKY